ncbi:MAG: hypothetical protein EAZ20_10885 [Bacteroidetes bacterium]|nr:MAG: hypothetical protein EAZ20_10885 [Bacteroidota bacterium]
MKKIIFYIIVIFISHSYNLQAQNEDFEKLLNQGRNYWVNSEYEKAQNIYQKIAQRYKKDTMALINLYYYIGNLKRSEATKNITKLDSAYKYYDFIFQNCFRIKDKDINSYSNISYSRILKNSLGEMADILLMKGHFDKALRLFEFIDNQNYPIDLKFSSYTDEYFQLFSLKRDIAICYTNLNQKDKAFSLIFPFLNKGYYTEKEANYFLLSLIYTQKYKLSPKTLESMIESAKILNLKSPILKEQKYHYCLKFKLNKVNFIDTLKVNSIIDDEINIIKNYQNMIKNTLFYQIISEDSIIDINTLKLHDVLENKEKNDFTLLNFCSIKNNDMLSNFINLIKLQGYIKNKIKIINIFLDTNTFNVYNFITKNEVLLKAFHCIETNGWENILAYKYLKEKKYTLVLLDNKLNPINNVSDVESLQNYLIEN